MCYGTPEVTEVTNYTEPTANQQMGVKLARVNYTYEVENIPDWIAEGGYTGRVADEIDYWTGGDPNPKEGQEILVLSGNGWVHQSEFSR